MEERWRIERKKWVACLSSNQAKLDLPTQCISRMGKEDSARKVEGRNQEVSRKGTIIDFPSIIAQTRTDSISFMIKNEKFHRTETGKAVSLVITKKPAELKMEIRTGLGRTAGVE